MLSLRRLACHLMDLFRHDLGPAYHHKTPAINPSGARRRCPRGVQVRGAIIEVNIYRFEQEAAGAAILTYLDTALENAGVDPLIPCQDN